MRNNAGGEGWWSNGLGMHRVVATGVVAWRAA